VTAFDPLNGRGKVLRSIERDPAAEDYASALSPDGSTLALSKTAEADIHILLLSLSGTSDRQIDLKNWPFITRLEWSPDGKGLYVGSRSPQGVTLLYSDLKGNAKVLWQQTGRERLYLGRTFAGRPLSGYRG
jgi:Tol biopolymer transport system component